MTGGTGARRKADGGNQGNQGNRGNGSRSDTPDRVLNASQISLSLLVDYA